MAKKGLPFISWFSSRSGPFLRKRRLAWIAALLVLFTGLFGFWKWVPFPAFRVPYSTVLLDRNGELLGAVTAADEQWRFPPTEEVPEKLVRSLTCFEDRRFFNHPGVDPAALVRALWQNLRAGRVVSGASTITMQVIRLSRMGKPRTLGEKLLEMILAFRLEWASTKREILAMYASHAPFGGNVVGIEAAAWRYFGRPPARLSWAESALIAVLPNSPALIHPGKNRQRLIRKRNALLEKMHQKGVMDDLTCRLAKLEPLPSKPVPLPRLAPHLLERFRQGKGGAFMHRKEAPASFLIRTTLRKGLQANTLETVLRHVRKLKGNGIHNAAAIIAEVDTGDVAAYVGNVTDDDHNDHGTHVDIIPAPRSTGSILKPFLYAAMLDAGELLPDELVADIPTRVGGFSPQNYSRTYEGAVPASMALARSLNVPAVRMLRKYGVDRFCGLLRSLGMTTLHRPAHEYGLSLILGGAEGNLWDLTGMYAGMARTAKGSPWAAKRRPHPLMRLTLLWNQTSERSNASHVAPVPSHNEGEFGVAACWLTLKAMLDVSRPGEDGAWRHFSSSRKIAWKTGTSYGYRDAWAIGVSPRYVVGVWVGNADGEGRPGLTGISTAGPLLFELFDLLEGSGWFERPESGLTEIRVCARSGYRAGPHCEKTRKAWVPASGLRRACCSYCRTIHCDRSLTSRVHGECERITDIKRAKWFLLPPAMAWYYRQKHAEYRPLPPYRHDCRRLDGGHREEVITLLYPDKRSEIYVPIELDGRRGRTVFEAAHRDPAMTLFWHLDDRFLGTTREIHQMAFTPAAGKHVITLVDENGEQVQRLFTALEKGKQPPLN